MNNFTTNTYEVKRDIFNFSEKISDDLYIIWNRKKWKYFI